MDLQTRQNSGVVGKTGGEERTGECPSRMSVRTTTIVSTTQTTMTTMTTATRTSAITSPPLSVLSKESDAIVSSIGSTESQMQVQVQSQVQDVKGESSGGSDAAFPSSSSSSSTVVPMTDPTKLSSNALMSFPASPQKLAAQPRKITAITKSQMRGELPLDRKDPNLLTFFILTSSYLRIGLITGRTRTVRFIYKCIFEFSFLTFIANPDYYFRSIAFYDIIRLRSSCIVRSSFRSI